MILYIIKRLLQFIPAMFVVSLLSFYISINSPGDPVEILSQSASAQGGSSSSYNASKQYKDSVRVKLGLNLPLFYFSLNTFSDCDTLHKILDKQEQYAFHRISRRWTDWKNTAKYFQEINGLQKALNSLNIDSIHNYYGYLEDTATELIPSKKSPLESDTNFQRRLLDQKRTYRYTVDEISSVISTSKNILSSLKRTYEPDAMRAKSDTLFKTSMKYDFLTKIRKQTMTLKEAENTYGTYSNNNYIPKFTWHGSTNQYHVWLVNLLHGDFGYSYVDTRPVAEKIWQKFIRSFTLILLSVLFAYIISIPIGLYAAKKQGKFFDRFSSLMLFILYAIPSFFFATLLLYFFSNPQYFSWFPESGYCDPEFYNADWTFFEKIYHTFPFMVLPLTTYTYASFAFISRIIRSATLDVLNQDYIRTARAKGLSETKVLWKHAFKNALLPVITTFVTIFPAAIGGSVIIETIFTYDGMGIASYEAIGNKDIPMIVSIFSLAGFMSMVAYFLADILYAFVDPRISFKSSKK